MFEFLKSQRTISVSPVSMLWFFGIILSLYFVFYIRSILIMVFLAFLVMTGLNPGVKKLETKYRVPRPIGIVLMFLLVLTFITTAIVIIFPPLVEQLSTILPLIDFPAIQDELRNFTFSLDNLQNVLGGVGSSVSALTAVVSSTFSGIFTFLTIMVLAFYMLADRDRLHLRVWWFTRNHEHVEQAKLLLDQIELQLGGWIRGQLILMLIIGVVTYIGLLLFGVQYALPLALLAGILEILPNLGPIIAAVPAIAVTGMTMGPGWALAVAVFCYVIQWFEANIIVPKVMKANADVSPIATIMVILIGLQVAGVVGALLSVPVYIVGRLVYGQWIKNRL